MLSTSHSPIEPLVPSPPRGRIYTTRRRIRLSDRDARGRLRLDAVARYLQDVATDDVDETGWGAPEHLWVIRRIRVDVFEPFLDDREVELATWCSGLAALAAGRRTSVTGDRGGRIEVDTVWIHLGPDERPARLDERFEVYAAAAGGRKISTRLELPDPPEDRTRTRWPVRTTDLDVLGHVNNAAYWHAIEERLARAGPDPRRPLRVFLDYRNPLDLDDRVDLVERAGAGVLDVGFVVQGLVKAAARVEGIVRAGN